MRQYIPDEEQLRILFHAMDSKAQNEIRWNELVNFILNGLTTEHAAEKLVCSFSETLNSLWFLRSITLNRAFQ